jgi:hypothetical protein
LSRWRELAKTLSINGIRPVSEFTSALRASARLFDCGEQQCCLERFRKKGHGACCPAAVARPGFIVGGCFISTLQAQGIEVGLVAKLAGHASAIVTLGHYTQAVRGAESAVAALERAFMA